MAIDKILNVSNANVAKIYNILESNISKVLGILKDSIGTPYAHYKCNDDAANTTVTDDGSGSNNGTASANTSNLSAVGKINDCFDFDNTYYIDINDLNTDIREDTEGTFTWWLYLDSTAASSFHWAFCKSTSPEYRFSASNDTTDIYIDCYNKMCYKRLGLR